MLDNLKRINAPSLSFRLSPSGFYLCSHHCLLCLFPPGDLNLPNRTFKSRVLTSVFIPLARLTSGLSTWTVTESAMASEAFCCKPLYGRGSTTLSAESLRCHVLPSCLSIGFLSCWFLGGSTPIFRCESIWRRWQDNGSVSQEVSWGTPYSESDQWDVYLCTVNNDWHVLC